MGGIAAGAAVLGHGHAGPGVPVGDVVAGAAGAGVAAVHHPGDAVGQQRTIELACLAVDAVALAEIALEHASAPLVAEPGIDLLQVHRPPGFTRVGRVHHTDTRVLERQAGQVARHVYRVVARRARPFALLGQQGHPRADADSEGGSER